MDHQFVASCAPGVETVDKIDETHFTAVSGFGVGSIKLRFRLDIELADLDPPNRAKMLVKGKAPGSAIQVASAIALEQVGDDRTRLRWNATSRVDGRVASVGARLMKGTAQRLTEEFWDRFAERAGEAG